MKKHIFRACVLLLLCAALTAGCSSSPSSISRKDGSYTLTLPISGQIIEVDEEYQGRLSGVTDKLLRAAEEKLAEETAIYPENSGYYLTVDQEGYLCLGVEVIRRIDPPISEAITDEDGGEYVIEAGCNIDHEHLFFQERISK